MESGTHGSDSADLYTYGHFVSFTKVMEIEVVIHKPSFSHRAVMLRSSQTRANI